MIKIGKTPTYLDALYIGKTYAGLLMGIPTVDMNNRTIGNLKTEAEKLMPWGHHKCVVIDPDRKPMQKGMLGGPGELLPDNYVFACVDGPATEENWCGATALLLFFIQPAALAKPIEQIIEDNCGHLNWVDIAANYDV